MEFRNTLATAALAAVALSACGPSRSEPDAGNNNPPGCVGACSPDAGTTDGGTEPQTDGGEPTTDGGTGDGGTTHSCDDFNPDAGTTTTMTVSEARSTACFQQSVRLENVVVSAVDYSSQGSQGDFTNAFWVTDPSSPQTGILVEKFYQDPPKTYDPKPGDVLTLDAVFQSEAPFVDRTGYRRFLANRFAFNRQPGGLDITVVETGNEAPAPVDAPEGFGNAEGGDARPNQEYAGALVHIPGPLEITNASPQAFERQSDDATDDVHFGFEVTGGILVNNYKTYDRELSDGGTEVRCDWRATALEAAQNGQKVVFPNGITGVWETYTHAPCEDGSTSGCNRRLWGKVPGTWEGTDRDSGNNYTFVLYPQDCEGLMGEVVAQ